MKALFNNKVIAESDETIQFDGSTYFPSDSIVPAYFRLEPNFSTTCGVKGTATYYTLHVNGEIRDQAAWVYEDPTPEAASVKGYFAFWKGIRILKN